MLITGHIKKKKCIIFCVSEVLAFFFPLAPPSNLSEHPDISLSSLEADLPTIADNSLFIYLFLSFFHFTRYHSVQCSIYPFTIFTIQNTFKRRQMHGKQQYCLQERAENKIRPLSKRLIYFGQWM